MKTAAAAATAAASVHHLKKGENAVNVNKLSNGSLPQEMSVSVMRPPQKDAVHTAQAFHAEIDNAERGQVDPKPPRWTSKLFGRSRFRRARIYDGLAVTLLIALMAALGTVVYAASAKADTGDDPESVAWAAHYAGAVCSTIADYPTTNGLLGIMNTAEGEGLTAFQAGQAVGISIYSTCPRYGYLIDLFVAKYGVHSAVA